MKTRQVIVTPLLLLFLLPACHKQSDDPDTAGGTRLRMMTIYEKENTERTDFLLFGYDSLDRLDSYMDSMRFRTDWGSFASTTFPTTHVYYDQQGQISKAVYREGGTADFPGGMYRTWFYDHVGLAVKSIFVSELERDTSIFTYAYDQNKRLIADTVVDNKHQGLVSFTTFVYDGNENVIQWSYYETASGTTRLILKADAVYDDHPNPFRSISFLKPPFGSDFSGLSRNNLLKTTYSNGAIDKHQYRYYSNGLPKSDLNTYVSDRTQVRSNNYYYD